MEILLWLLLLAGGILVGFMVFMLSWEELTKRRVLANTDCLSFAHSNLWNNNVKLAFWRSALIIQNRCAESGHTACSQCEDLISCCYSRECDICGSGYHDAGRTIGGSMDSVSRSWDADLVLAVYGALAATETLDDVLAVFTETDEVPLDIYSLQSSDSAFYRRCVELAKRKYKDLPFAVKWEFAQDAAHQRLAERAATWAMPSRHT